MRSLVACLALVVACSESGTPYRGDGGSIDGGAAAPDGGSPEDAGSPSLDGGASDGGATDGGGASGAPCQRTRECGEGTFCGPGRTCEPAGAAAIGERCETTAACTAGLICTLDGLTGRCDTAGTGDTGTTCVSERDCVAGLYCLPIGNRTTCQSPLPPDGGAAPFPPFPVWNGVSCEEDTGPARAYFEVPRADVGADFYRLPFPNDVRRTATGLDLAGHPHPQGVLPVDVMDLVLRASAEDLRGWSTNPVLFFRFSQRYDWETIGGEPPTLKLVDVTRSSPEYGRESGLFWITTYGPVSRYLCPDWLALRTPHGAPLRPATTYAAILTTGIRPQAGGSFQRPPDLVALLAPSAPPELALAAAYAAYAPLRAYLADAGIDPATVLNATVFTTQDPEELVPRLRAAVRAAPAPAVTDLTACTPQAASPCADGTPQRACSPLDDTFVEIHGRMALSIFQQGTPPYEREGGGIALDLAGRPVSSRTEPVCFALTVPRGAAPPGPGFPLLVFAHGTGGAFTDAVRGGFAAAVSAGGDVRAATLAIDLPQHGSRRGASLRPPEELLFNYANPRAARDSVLQGAADLFSIAHLVAGFQRAAGESPTGQAIRFDGARIALFAHSQGATHASLALPFEPGYSAAVLSGNGGDLTASLLDKRRPFDVAAALPFALADGHLDETGRPRLNVGEFHPALALFQGFFDRADPVNFAWRLRRVPLAGDGGRHVFMTSGIADTFTPVASQRAFAVSAGLTQVAPVLQPFGLPAVGPPLAGNASFPGGSKTVGLRQYAAPAGLDGHFVATDTEAGRADVVRFLLQALGGQTPQIGAP